MSAQRATKVTFDEAMHVFRLDTAQTSYVFGVNQSGQLQSLYWGERLSDADQFGAALQPRQERELL